MSKSQSESSQAASSSSLSHKKTSRVKILKWRSVAKWTWGFQEDEECVICQFPFDSACAQCKSPGDDCILLWGKCNHAFHAHCIMKWLQNSPESAQTCPHCRAPWEIKID